MFRSMICAAAFSVASFTSVAVETLDVLVVYDNNTISNVSELNSEQERDYYADKLIRNLNKTFSNSGLSSQINFRLEHQLKTGFTNAVSGKTENLEQIKSRYFNYAANNSNTGDASGWLYTLQNAYKADVVIGVFQQGTDVNKFCGMATSIPSESHKAGDTANQVQEFAGYGLFFISTESGCLNRDRLVSHEFGHTAGLFHEPTSSANSEMLHDGAAGYRSIWSSVSSVMIQKNNQLYYQENRFSDSTKSECGAGDNYVCGNTSSNAVATLKQFASQYNKRGNWYYNNWFSFKI